MGARMVTVRMVAQGWRRKDGGGWDGIAGWGWGCLSTHGMTFKACTSRKGGRHRMECKCNQSHKCMLVLRSVAMHGHSYMQRCQAFSHLVCRFSFVRRGEEGGTCTLGDHLHADR